MQIQKHLEDGVVWEMLINLFLVLFCTLSSPFFSERQSFFYISGRVFYGLKVVSHELRAQFLRFVVTIIQYFIEQDLFHQKSLLFHHKSNTFKIKSLITANRHTQTKKKILKQNSSNPQYTNFSQITDSLSLFYRCDVSNSLKHIENTLTIKLFQNTLIKTLIKNSGSLQDVVESCSRQKVVVGCNAYLVGLQCVSIQYVVPDCASPPSYLYETRDFTQKFSIVYIRV